ncbi:uncharacterized protein LOC111913082 [Lactuca sativa]|uniref:uncharacterized protein LOC111913082 n=1 Tax=Lactuca sativa TaxID=4236 RepID=UPI000CD87021|nr:uncharacterized protein LOC111913082 [Lactuca sativa]
MVLQDLWIWHDFFGSPGSINDINVLNRSPIFNNLYDISTPDSFFQVHGTPYKYGYYLVDVVYLEYVVFVKSFTYPNDSRRKKFKRAQERARKDVERAFGVLKKYEGRAICTYDTYETIPETLPLEIGGDKYMDRKAEIHNNETFHNLRMNLVEHLYGIQNIDLNLDPPKDNEDEF